MTNANTPSGNEDLVSSPEVDQLGESGNPFSGDTKTADTAAGDTTTTDAAVDASPGAQDSAGDTDQNPPLPDWGATDGVHGVDGDTES
jgi:hypothetical protein